MVDVVDKEFLNQGQMVNSENSKSPKNYTQADLM